MRQRTALAIFLPPLTLGQSPSCLVNATPFQSFPRCGFLKLKIVNNSHRHGFYLAVRWCLKGVQSSSGWVAGPGVVLICEAGELESTYTQCAHTDTCVYFLCTDGNKAEDFAHFSCSNHSTLF